MSQPADSAARRAALDPTRSICVTAPAGSGKTELLTQRVLALLAVVRQPEEILAITFTRKAAAEMHGRIFTALQRAASEMRPAEPHRQQTWDLARAALEQDAAHGWQLLTNPGRLRVQTIDSLSASLTRQMPVLSQFGAQPAITDQAEPLYREAVRELFGLLDADELGTPLMALLAHFDNHWGRVQDLLVEMLARRDQWLVHIGSGAAPESARQRLEYFLQRVIADTLVALEQSLLPHASELLALVRWAGANLGRESPDHPLARLAASGSLPLAEPSALPLWQALADMLLTRSGEWRRSLDKRCGFIAGSDKAAKLHARAMKERCFALMEALDSNGRALPLLQNLSTLPAPHYREQQWQLLAALTQLLPALVAQLNLVFQQRGLVDHSEISLRALQALGDGLAPSELRLKLDYRLSHVLVDEFQDTSNTQFELLKRLVEGWAEYNATDPASPHTLFIVGDGMQSIYGFREANVGLFLEARQLGVNGLELLDLPLSVNFRSDPAVTEWVNRVFQPAFPAVPDLARGAVPYEPASAFREAQPDAQVQVFGFSGDDAREREARQVVALVQNSVQLDPAGSIAVLVRSRPHLLPLLKELSAAGIDWSARDIDPLAHYGSVQDLLVLTRALVNVADDIAWASLLRTPWCGLDNRDLCTLLENGPPPMQAITDPVHWAGLSAAGRERLQRLQRATTTALAMRARLPLRDWIEGTWLALGGAAALVNENEAAAVDGFFQLLEAHTEEQLDLLEQALTRQYIGADSGAETGLTLMTIHKAKGLEFDTVIVPGLARAPRSDSTSLLLWRETVLADGDTALLLSPAPTTGGDDAIYRHLRAEQKRARALEDIRLFYVAATRAARRLYLTLSVAADEAGEPATPPANSLAAALWETLQPEVAWDPALPSAPGQLGLDFAAIAGNGGLRRLPAAWVLPAAPQDNPLQEYYMPAAYGDEPAQAEAPPLDPYAAAVGTVVHQVLQQLAVKGPAWWQEDRQPWLRSLLQAQALPAGQSAPAAAEVTAHIERVLADERGRWILSREHPHSAAEWALAETGDYGLREHVLDRYLVDSEGCHWIIDYKTGVPAEGEDAERFIAREEERHRAQLQRYARVLRSLLSAQGHEGPVKAALYFTGIARWQEVVT